MKKLKSINSLTAQQFQPPNTPGEIEKVIHCFAIEVSSRIGSAQEFIEMLTFSKIA